MKVCQCCGNVSDDRMRFCENCGTKLPSEPADPKIVEATKQTPNVDKAQDFEIDDRDLYLLADCCNKTCALPTGDRYSEIVLYRDDKTDSYQIHTYAGSNGRTDSHKAYYTDEAFCKEVEELIDKEGIIKYKDAKGPGLCGGDYIVKFRDKNGGLVRLSTSNYGNEGIGIYNKISSLLYSGINPGRRIIPEYMKSWSKIGIKSVSPVEEYNYSIELEKNENGTVLFKGFRNYQSEAFRADEFVALSEDTAKFFADYPFGGLDRKRAAMPILPGMLEAGFAGNKPEVEFGVTYENGLTEEKEPDSIVLREIFKKLNEELN